MGVHDFLDVGKQARGVLDLVEDDGRGIQGKKATRISRGRGPNVGELERAIAAAPAEQVLEECGLAGLAGAGEHNRGELLRRTPKGWLEGSGDVAHSRGSYPSTCNYAFGMQICRYGLSAIFA